MIMTVPDSSEKETDVHAGHLSQRKDPKKRRQTFERCLAALAPHGTNLKYDLNGMRHP